MFSRSADEIATFQPGVTQEVTAFLVHLLSVYETVIEGSFLHGTKALLKYKTAYDQSCRFKSMEPR